MTTFTQSAFARVDDPEQRKVLIEWLDGIGRKVIAAPNTHLIAYNGEGVCIWMELEHQTDKVFAKEFIDYGNCTLKRNGRLWNKNVDTSLDIGMIEANE